MDFLPFHVDYKKVCRLTCHLLVNVLKPNLALISGSNNIRNIFQMMLNLRDGMKSRQSGLGLTGIDNFVLIEAKRRALGGELTAYLPQVIGESLSVA